MWWGDSQVSGLGGGGSNPPYHYYKCLYCMMIYHEWSLSQALLFRLNHYARKIEGEGELCCLLV